MSSEKLSEGKVVPSGGPEIALTGTRPPGYQRAFWHLKAENLHLQISTAEICPNRLSLELTKQPWQARSEGFYTLLSSQVH